MVSQISNILASQDLNIDNMLNKKYNDIAYNIIDLTQTNIDKEIQKKLESIEGVFMVRIIEDS